MASERNTILTQSSMGCIQECACKYNLRYNEGYESIDRPEALTVGTAFHAGVEAFRKHGTIDTFAVNAMLNGLESDHRCLVTAMLKAYTDRYADDDWTYDAVEKQLHVVNPLDCDGVDIRGVADAIVLIGGRRYLVETKTTARIDGTYLESLWYKRQTLMYSWLLDDIAGVIYDLIQKPSIRRLKATPEEKRKYTKDGMLNARQRAVDESDEEYSARLDDWYELRPEALHRETVIHSEAQIQMFEADISGVAALVKHFEREGHWPRSLSACFAYGRPCEFALFCQSNNSQMILDTHFQKRERPHPELEEEDDSTNTK